MKTSFRCWFVRGRKAHSHVASPRPLVTAILQYKWWNAAQEALEQGNVRPEIYTKLEQGGKFSVLSQMRQKYEIFLMHCVISWSCDLFYTLNDAYRKQRVGEHRKCTTRTCLRWTHTTHRTWAGTVWTALFKVVLKLLCAFQSWEALPHTWFIF